MISFRLKFRRVHFKWDVSNIKGNIFSSALHILHDLYKQQYFLYCTKLCWHFKNLINRNCSINRLWLVKYKPQHWGMTFSLKLLLSKLTGKKYFGLKKSQTFFTLIMRYYATINWLTGITLLNKATCRLTKWCMIQMTLLSASKGRKTYSS